MANRHVIVALLAAPALAIIAWFAVDAVVREEPAPAVSGQVYRLLPAADCRQPGRQCTLGNGGMRLTIRYLSSGTAAGVLRVESRHALDGVHVGTAPMPGAPSKPQAMRAVTGSFTVWELKLGAAPECEAVLQFAARAGGSDYVAETGIEFIGNAP